MRNLLILILALTLSACGGSSTSSLDLSGQPAYPGFPEPGQHWVIDKACNFDVKAVAQADKTLEQLRLDGIAEVAVLCVSGVKDQSALNDGLIWFRNWTRYVRLGNAKDDRSIAFLIRPDMDPDKGDRVIAERSYNLYLSVVDYGPIVENAADWANQGQFTGALNSIVRDINSTLRERQCEITGTNCSPSPARST